MTLPMGLESVRSLAGALVIAEGPCYCSRGPGRDWKVPPTWVHEYGGQYAQAEALASLLPPSVISPNK